MIFSLGILFGINRWLKLDEGNIKPNQVIGYSRLTKNIDF